MGEAAQQLNLWSKDWDGRSGQYWGRSLCWLEVALAVLLALAAGNATTTKTTTNGVVL